MENETKYVIDGQRDPDQFDYHCSTVYKKEENKMSGKTTNIDIETSNEIMAVLNNNADKVANAMTEDVKSQYIKNEGSIEVINKKIELCDDGTAKVYCQINSDMDIRDLIMALYERISDNEIFIVKSKYKIELVVGKVYYIELHDNKLATIHLKRG